MKIKKHIAVILCLCVAMTFSSCEHYGLTEGVCGQYYITFARINGAPAYYQGTTNYCKVTKMRDYKVRVELVFPEGDSPSFSEVSVAYVDKGLVSLSYSGDLDFISGSVLGDKLVFNATTSTGKILYIKATK